MRKAQMQNGFVSWLTIVCSAGIVAGAAQAAPDTPLVSGREIRNPVSRDLQQLRENVERWKQLREVERLEDLRREARETEKTPLPEEEAPAFRFKLNAVEHNKSDILSVEEIGRAVEPWVGREVDMKGIQAMLEAVNRLYREKGYAVCEARLKPQRIKDGRLFVTLVEGKTGDVSVVGNEHTRDVYILEPFDLKRGGGRLPITVR